MRVVAGEYKGRVIDSPDGSITRPTTDRVRESIFSSVYSRILELDEVCVLDAFAGSGALGIEALSRGAAACTFFEQDAKARKVLEGNIASLGIAPAHVRVRPLDVFTASGWGGPFGLVLLDPPYAYEPVQVHELLKKLAVNGDLAERCVIVYEHALKNKQEVVSEFEQDVSFALTGQKKYGKIGVSYFRYNECEG